MSNDIATQLAGQTSGLVLSSLDIAGNGRGLVPLGAIIAVTSGFTGAMAVPATGVVSNGFMRADGAVIPVSNALSGTTPNLANSVYLRGASTYSGTGGSNTKTLSTNELPSHSHTMTHGHSNGFGLTGTTTFASSDHTHGMDHYHQWSWFNNNAASPSYDSGWSPNTGSDANAATTWGELTYNSIFNSGTFQVGPGANPTINKAFIKPGVTAATYTGRGLTGGASTHKSATDGPSGTASVGFTGAVTDFTGSTVLSGSGNSFNNEPSYINVIYLMRVN